MTDSELETFLGIAGTKQCKAIIAAMKPEERAGYEQMAEVERQLKLYDQGLGPKPSGVMICRRHR